MEFLYRQSQYNQVGAGKQKAIFGTEMTFPALLLEDNGQHSKPLYINPLANSSYSICPIRIAFEKEEYEGAREEGHRIKGEIRDVECFTYHPKTYSGKLAIKFKVHLSKLDQKLVCYMCESKAMASCPWCGATPSEVRDDKTSKFKVEDESELIALSSLHFGINAVKNILNVGYKQVS